MDLDKTPLMAGDFVRLQMVVTIQTVAACSSSAEDFERRLTDIANRLFDMASGTTDQLSEALLRELSSRLMATE